MGKKVSKNSRASRRYEALDTEAQTLAQLPRAQNLDVTNKLIRTASKSERLLEAKMKKKERTGKKVGKKDIKKGALENLDSDRVARALNITNRLDGKVEKAKARAKYVQAARKAGWESTNESIRRALAKNEEKEQAESNHEDNDIDVEAHSQDEIEEKIEQPEKPASSNQNLFGLLSDDVEA
ncbi:LAFA_0C10462g1_1 [Lachancea sp. 'fantastica']|nr:LAFA_0C10462g1_1 [Lachancea sp. 'fantastica']